MTAASLLGAAERSDDLAVQRALQQMRLNRQREAVFGPALSVSPIWDLLLELFIHRAAGIDAEEDMISTRITPRYRRLMEARGLICRGRYADSLTLTNSTFNTMTRLLRA